MRTDPALVEQLPGMITAAGGDAVVRLEVNPRAGSLTVWYDCRRVTADELLRAFEAGGLMAGHSNGYHYHSHRNSGPSRGGITYLLGSAIGHAMFGAALKTGVEKSVLGLVGRFGR
ncbi:MAG: hypothetical protein U1E33_01485 [Rhodospirillales bacterium]